jgi:hypothetical protein
MAVMPRVVERSLWPSACDAASTPATRSQLGREGAPDAVHVQARANTVADEVGQLEPSNSPSGPSINRAESIG